MPRTIRFHLDENCHHAVAEGLRRRGVDVTTTAEAGMCSASDEQQLAQCLAQGRVFLTHDRDFLRLHAAGTSHAGIAYCDKDSRSIGQMVQSLVVVWEILEAEEIKGRVEFI